MDKNENNSVEVNRTIYVDSKYGNDTTGFIDNTGDPVQTIGRAIELLKKNRHSKKEPWNISIRPGEYEFIGSIPTNVSITGSGLSTTIIGKLNAHSNCQLINFKFIGITLPCIEINFKPNSTNAVALFFGVDVFLSPKLNQLETKFQNEIRTAIVIDSKANNATAVLKDSRFVFELDEITKGENKFILVNGGRAEFFTSIIRATGNSSIRNTIIDHVGGSVDVEFGNTIYQSSHSSFGAPAVFYSSSSPFPFFVKNNKQTFRPLSLDTLPHSNKNKDKKNKKNKCTNGIPNRALIAYLSQNNSLIKSRNCISDWYNFDPENEYIYFTTSEEAQSSILNYSNLGANVGKVGTFNNLDEKRIDGNAYLVSNDGELHQSGARVTIPNIINDLTLKKYIPETTEQYIQINNSAKNFTVELNNNNESNIIDGRNIQITNKSNKSIRVQVSPHEILKVPKNITGSFQYFVGDLKWRTVAVTPIESC